jgi:AcrR family transcriptional regulator
MEAPVGTTEALTKSQRTKEFFLQQALSLFQEDGYEAVTMRDLAKACDASLGSFYYHFRSKEEIVLELFKASLSGHIDRTQKYLSTREPKLEAVMTWICRDRFKEFTSHKAVLRVLVQRLDPHDPASAWHESSLPIREESVELFEQVVTQCMPKLDARTKRQLARALWLQHLLILAVWSFDRSADGKETESILKQSNLVWKSVHALVRVPGIKNLINLLLGPLERLEKGRQ